MLASGLAFAQAPTAAPVPQGEPRSGGELLDPDFRVTTRQFGLDRRVEMYQWRVGEDGYRRVWNSALIDSSGFAPGHENPPDLPLGSERWWAQDATLDGRPLDVAVLRTLGQWRGFRPGFSRLPANLAATFQPEGDGLGSSENPLDPQIGDLRVSWRELVLPPLAGKVELRGGAWRLPANAVATRGPTPQSSSVESRSNESGLSNYWPWWLGGIALLLAIGVARRVGRRRQQR